MKIAAIVLAAGSAERMGCDKLNLRIDGERVLNRALAPLVSAARLSEVVLVVQPDFAWPDSPIRCRVVVNPDYAQGMGRSLATGVAASPEDTDAFLIALADMPGLCLKTLDTIITAYQQSPKKILRPMYRGQGGHPVIVHRDYRDQLINLVGDTGAQGILSEEKHEVLEFEVDDPAVVMDIDHPHDVRCFSWRRASGQTKILVKGGGEIASATAHRLFCCGFTVVMTETAFPTTIRRQVAFASAVQHQEIRVEGVLAKSYGLDQLDILQRFDRSHIPVFVDPSCELAQQWQPDVLIDGRVLKCNDDTGINDAPLVIGLGPGFQAGADVDVVVETNRGHNLARLITQGSAEPNTSIPGAINDYTNERVLRAPVSGVFEAKADIGDQLEVGALVGQVGAHPVTSRIKGVVRGLIHPGYSVQSGQKIGDVDPRCSVRFCSTISEKARAISGTCLEAVLRCGKYPTWRSHNQNWDASF